ncbi:hypothetical protein [Ahrensia sp. R2A130]|uniref:hypothetical protein n=1 Tax=Ahrensia sp. R2A130 TaxID=744979 RepID=UPI0001E0F83F|nr:hypothetical protein [Ahrensia sp. R2A130]EFL90487.1 conserved hypothetical protein [Ahrensia sp. R2A130]
MTMIMDNNQADTSLANRFALPKIDVSLIATATIAGAFATLGFDLFGQTISPMLKSVASPFLGAKLAPVALANQSLAVILGLPGKTISGLGIGHAMHLLTGLLLYPLGYMLVFKPIADAILRTPWWVKGAVYGAALFVFALYIMAHLVAGNPPFLGWGGITWVALWGHMVFGLIVAWFDHRRAI